MSRAIFKMRGSPRGIVIVGSVAGNTGSGGTEQPLGNIDVGPTNPDKNAIFVITAKANTGFSIEFFSIGGVNLTQILISPSSGTPKVTTFLFAGDISSINGSQSIVVRFSTSAMFPAACSGVSVLGLLSLIPIYTDIANTNGGTNPLVLTGVLADAGGIILSGHVSENRDSATTWESLTEQIDKLTPGSETTAHRHSSAWDLGERAAADEDITSSLGSRKSCVVASFL